MSNSHNQGRMLTLRIKIVDPDTAAVIWESLKCEALMAGCLVLAVANDDLFAENRRLEDRVNELENRFLGT